MRSPVRTALGTYLVLATPLRGCAGPVGAPCVEAAECHAGPEPECRDWPQGYCTSRCETDRDCGALGACVEEGDDGSVCLQRCDPERGCRKGYRCRGTREGAEVCLPE